jgi:diguanylate cyclase (GGDEF)-like protein/PAS domain S-box-containing protein
MKTIRLRVWLPALVFLLSTAIIAGIFFYQLTIYRQHLTEHSLQQVEQIMARLQRIIESSPDINKIVAQEFSELSTQSEITALALSDEHGIVIKAIHYDWVGQSIKNLYPDFSVSLFHRALLNKRSQIRYLADQHSIQAYYPVQLQTQAAELRPLVYGVLILNYDLSLALEQITYDSLINSLFFWLISIAITFLFIAILNRLITHPATYLSRLMHQFALTEEPVTARLGGKGELVQLAQAFNHLVKRLTESKKHLIHQKNLYQTLSKTNQLIIRVANKKKLLQEACQIIADHGEFHFVWASFCNSDNVFITSAGESSTCQQFNRNPPSDEDICHRLPTNQAPVIINNIQPSRSDIPFLHQLKLEREIKSYARFPLYQFNQIVGQIAIYSHQPHYFTEEIIHLLQGLNHDISFALEKIKLDQLRKKAEAQLREREKNLEVTLDSIGDAVIVTDKHGQITRMNAVAENLTGWSFCEAKHKPLEQIFHIINAITRKPAENPVNKVMKNGQIVGLANHTALIAKDGTEYQIADSAAPIKDHDGKILGIILVFHDVTEEYRLHEQVRKSAERFQHVHEISGAYAWETDTQGHYTFLTDQCFAVKGYKPKQLLGRKIYDLLPETEATRLADVIQNILQSKQQKFSITLKNILPGGQVVWEQIHGSAIFDQHHQITGLRGAGICINEQVEAESRIKKLAFYDPLTGLPNRRMLLDRLKKALNIALRHKKNGALLFLDLDHFKNLNDSLGHDAGDELLKQVAARLKTQLREEDTAARLGGDEFIILLTDVGSDNDSALRHTRVVSEKIQTALSQEFQLKGHSYRLSLSIGITLFPQPDIRINDLIKQADTALYRAKSLGRNQFQFFSQEMQDAAEQRLAIEKELYDALMNQHLHLYFQPQLNHQGQIIGAESLIRWHHPQKGLLAPNVFIPIAEESNLIVDLGLWIIENAFIQRKQWQQNKLLSDSQKLSINISPKQFRQDDFVQSVLDLLHKHQLNAELFIFEITENLFLHDLDKIILKIKELKQFGFHFSIDDFGTGYSSLAYLKRLPISELKIDRTFVTDLESDPNDRAIVETIIAMAEHMDLQVIAEGVENRYQLDFLINRNCLHFQGYYFSQPLPAEDFEAFVCQKQ